VAEPTGICRRLGSRRARRPTIISRRALREASIVMLPNCSDHIPIAKQTETSVAVPQAELCGYQRSTNMRRDEYWDGLAERCRDGPP